MRTKVGFFMNNKKKFSKPSLTIDEQTQLLTQQGLIIKNPKTANYVLSVVNYYRLSGYLLPFKQPHNNNGPRYFKSNTTFDQIWQLYQFDQELRLLVTDAIEKIEVAFRTAIANVTSHRLGAFWYIDRSHYRNKQLYTILMKQVEKIIRDKHEPFIKHYMNTYSEPYYPPIWMVIETLSFGTCSKLFSNIKHVNNKKAICEIFNYAPTVFDSWMRTLAYIRNICAHHARLWNRWLVNSPILPKDSPARQHFYDAKNYKFNLVAYVIYKLLQEIAPKSTWREKLYKLFEKYEQFPGPAMGITNNWREDPFWEL